MACHKEAGSMHEAPKRQREREREEEVPAGNTVGSEGDDWAWAPWNGGARSFSGSSIASTGRGWLAGVLAGRFGAHDSILRISKAASRSQAIREVLVGDLASGIDYSRMARHVSLLPFLLLVHLPRASMHFAAGMGSPSILHLMISTAKSGRRGGVSLTTCGATC